MFYATIFFYFVPLFETPSDTRKNTRIFLWYLRQTAHIAETVVKLIAEPASTVNLQDERREYGQRIGGKFYRRWLRCTSLTSCISEKADMQSRNCAKSCQTLYPGSCLMR